MRPSTLTTSLFAPLLTRSLPPGPRPRVLLTFDDGPVPGATEGVLERLAAHGVPALFCMVGWRVAAAPHLVRAAAEAGHALGNHSQHHGMGRLPWPGSYWRDMDACSRAIEAACGQAPRYFRAPGGRLHPASLLGPGSRGLRHVLWSLDPEDWRCADAGQARDAARRTLAEARDGDIILLHDFSPVVHDLLDVLLPGLADAGLDAAAGLQALAALDGPVDG